MINAVILDFDDTVCMTEAVCFEIENEVIATMGGRSIPRELHLATWGKPLFEIIDTRSPGVNVSEFRKVYNSLLPEAIAQGRFDAISSENFEAMDRLLAMSKELVVLTSREHNELAHLLEPDHDLAERISTFYYKDNMQFHKPDPRAFSHIEAEHGWKPEECVYVGDSLGDARASKGANIHFIASLESGLRTREEFESQPEFPVDSYILRFSEIVQAVEDLDKHLPA